MTTAPTVCLPARQLFGISDASTVRILCTAGCLWLTLDHDTRDVILQPGDSFSAGEARRALLYAFEPSAFALEVPEQRAMAREPSTAAAGWQRAPALWAATRAANPG